MRFSFYISYISTENKHPVFMGNSHSSLLGRALREVELYDQCRPDDSASTARLDWASEFPDFYCWSKDFSMSTEYLFLFMLNHIIPAKRRWGLPMSLFPQDAPGNSFVREEPPLEERTEWTQAPSDILNAEEAIKASEHDGLRSGRVFATAVECDQESEISHLSWKYRVTAVALTTSPREGANDNLRSLIATLSFAPALSDWSDLTLGEHIMYVDTETSRYHMEHHLIVVDIRWDGTSTRPQILCVGVMLQSRWIYASLTLVDLNKAISRMKHEPILMRVSIGEPHDAPAQTSSDATQLALAGVGLHGVWFGSTMNCEDWANWISTGWVFSIQRMRSVAAMSLHQTSLIRRDDERVFDKKDLTLHCVDPLEFSRDCSKLRNVRLLALQPLQTHENFN